MGSYVEIVHAPRPATSGHTEQVDPSQRRALMMASAKLRKHWRAGELPPRTTWASDR